MEVDSGSSHFGRWSVSRRESGGGCPRIGVDPAGGIATRRARPIRFVVAHEWKVKESVGADVLGGPQPRSNANRVVGRLRAAEVFDSPR